jgi:hypothetical protein
VLGPIADLKLSVPYGATFRRRWFVPRLLLVTVPLIVAGSLERRGKRFLVAADRIARVPAPKQPY